MRDLALVVTLVTALAGGAVTGRRQMERSASCQSSIVSATVVATFCGHFADGTQLLDLFILWRGGPGWFQHGANAGGGSAGSREVGAGTKGKVYESTDYGGVTIAFYADFDAATVSIEGKEIPIRDVNTIFVDGIDGSEAARIVRTLHVEPNLPLADDVNAVLARRSPEIRQFLECQTPMPSPPISRAGVPIRQPAVITVCEKLRKR